MAGIEELKDIVETSAKLGSALGRALQDGSINIGDLAEFLPAILSIPAAIDGINEVPAEVEDLTEEETTELLDFLKSNFDLPNDGTEQMIEDHIAVLRTIYLLVSKYYLKKAN